MSPKKKRDKGKKIFKKILLDLQLSQFVSVDFSLIISELIQDFYIPYIVYIRTLQNETYYGRKILGTRKESLKFPLFMLLLFLAFMFFQK